MIRKSLLMVFLAASFMARSQETYPNYDQLKSQIQSLEKSNKKISVENYGKSFGGLDLMAVKISNDNKPKPALLVVAGLDGKHLSGTYMALQIIKKWTADAQANALLNTYDLWVIPAASPDVLSAFSQRPLYEKSGNTRKTDDDRNGYVGDDPYEDLNKDGLITYVKIESPLGTLVESKEDSRVLIPANPQKGEVGKYMLISEGLDNNKNKAWNDDNSDGVNINQNFAFDYPFFQKGSGAHAASESETRALMDFVHKYPTIYGILVLGLNNNITDPQKFDATLTKNRIITGLLEADAKTVQQLSKRFTESTQWSDAPKLPLTQGSFAQTAYFHIGKTVMASPGWWATAPKVKDSTDIATKKENDKADLDAHAQYKLAFLKWADAHQVDAFLEWKSFNHPDFPGQKAWIGGLKPYQLYHPPVTFLDSAAVAHQKFLKSWFEAMPKLEIATQQVEKIGDQLYRITLTVVNKGMLPTYTSMGDKIRFTSRMKTEIALQNKQKRISGPKVQLNNALQPNESLTLEWLVSGNGHVVITSGCATAGEIRWEVSLK